MDWNEPDAFAGLRVDSLTQVRHIEVMSQILASIKYKSL